MKKAILMFGLAIMCMVGCITPDPPIPPLPPVVWGNLIGAGMFYGVMPWKGNGIYNDAPKDMTTLVAQFAQAGGNIFQVQLLYEDGALFVPGKGLTMDPARIAYCTNFVSICRKQGVNVLFVLFDNCTLKYPAKWAVSPLNRKNGGPFYGCYDLYKNAPAVSAYVTQAVQNLNGENVAFEIINEGTSQTFGTQVRDMLTAIGVSRKSTSGSMLNGLWKYSAHGQIHASAVKTGQLPNTDGQTWNIVDVAPICAAVRATPESGLVFDGVTDAKHNWAEFLSKLR